MHSIEDINCTGREVPHDGRQTILPEDIRFLVIVLSLNFFYPMSELRIRGDFGSGEILCRLQQAKRWTKFSKLLFVGVTFDDVLIKAVRDLFSQESGEEEKQWDRVFLSMCRGEIRDVIDAIAKANVSEFRFYEHHLEPPRSCPFEILSSSTLRGASFENMPVTKDQGTILAKYLSMNERLDTFSICCGRVDASAVAELARGLQSNKTLTSIRISNCLLGDDEVSDILKSIANSPQLQRLSIDGNRCREKSMEVLSSLLRQPDTSLLDLDVSHQEGGLDSRCFSTLLSSLKNNTTLKALRMRNNFLLDDHLKSISRMLCRNNTIVDLDLRFNSFTSEGISESVAADLLHYEGLRRIQLRTGSGVLRKDLLDNLVRGMENNWKLLCLDLFEWDKRLLHFLDLNRSNRLVFQEDDFPPALWPLVFERAVDIVERSLQEHLRGNKLRANVAERKASVLFYFLRNSSTLLNGV